MKDFDAERHERAANTDGRTFKIGGETLVARGAVSPDVWIDYFDKRRENAAVMSNRDYTEFLDDHIRSVLDPESVHLWERVRKDADPPISLGDIDQVVDFLWELQSSRPTGRAAASSNGSATETTGTTSTADSSETRETVSTG